MYEPWIGTNYCDTGLLVLGESAYSWWEEDELRHPTPDHSLRAVTEVIANFDEATRFFKLITRALANEEQPSEGRVKSVWNRVAFSNYVDGTIGQGPRTRPSEEMWAAAKERFLKDLYRSA